MEYGWFVGRMVYWRVIMCGRGVGSEFRFFGGTGVLKIVWNGFVVRFVRVLC